MNTDIQIYIADLAAYNAGHLHGVWMDATLPVDEMQELISIMLSQSPVEDAEEWALHDYSGFEDITLNEWKSLESVHNIANLIEEYGQLGAAIYNDFDDIDQATEVLEERYHGCYSSLAEYAEEYTDSTAHIPDHLQSYIDYERMARDWELSGDIFTIETAHDEVHVFRGY